MDCTAGIDRRHAAADDDHAAADSKRGQVGRLAKFGDELDGIFHAVALLALGTQRIDACKAKPEEDRIVAGSEFRQRIVAAERLAVDDRDAADRGDIVHFGLGKIVRALVRGDAIFVQPPGLRPRLEHSHLMAIAREPVRGGEARLARRPTTATFLPVDAARS